MKNKNIIVLMGGPGCGKGTISAELRARHKMQCIETGVLFRALPTGSKIAQSIAAGNLAPDAAAFELIGSRLSGDEDIILDGFPRTLPQSEWFIENYANNANIKIIYLNVSPEIMKQRIQKRLNEGSERADDAAIAIVENRIKNFAEQTMPAIEWLRNCQGIEFNDIDATGQLESYMDTVCGIGKSYAL